MICSDVGSVVCLSPWQSVCGQVHAVVGCGTCAGDCDWFVVIGNQQNSWYSSRCCRVFGISARTTCSQIAV